MLNSFNHHLSKRNKTSDNENQVIDNGGATEKLINNPSAFLPVLSLLVETPKDFLAFMRSSKQCKEAAINFIEYNPTKYLPIFTKNVIIEVCQQSLNLALAVLQNSSLLELFSLKEIIDIAFNHKSLRDFYLSHEPFTFHLKEFYLCHEPYGIQIMENYLTPQALGIVVEHDLKHNTGLLKKFPAYHLFNGIHQNLELFKSYMHSYGEYKFFDTYMRKKSCHGYSHSYIVQGMLSTHASQEVSEYIMSLPSFKEKVCDDELAYIIYSKPSLKPFIENDPELSAKLNQSVNPTVGFFLLPKGPCSQNAPSTFITISKDQLLGGLKQYIDGDSLKEAFKGDIHSKQVHYRKFKTVRIDEARKDLSFAKKLIEHGALDEDGGRLAIAMVSAHPSLTDNVLDNSTVISKLRLNDIKNTPTFFLREPKSQYSLLMRLGFSSIKATVKLLSFKNIALDEPAKERLRRNIDFAKLIQAHAKAYSDLAESNSHTCKKRKIDNV